MDRIPYHAFVILEKLGYRNNFIIEDPKYGKNKYAINIGTRDVEKELLYNNEYDGAIIRNVLDYGSYVVDQAPNTVYECIDNSQVKSVFNNGQFANPDDMYASPQGESNMGASSRLSNIPSKGDISTL